MSEQLTIKRSELERLVNELEYVLHPHFRHDEIERKRPVRDLWLELFTLDELNDWRDILGRELYAVKREIQDNMAELIKVVQS